MIAIRDILIFLAGMGVLYVSQLTHRYFYGKRIIASNMTHKEEPYRPRQIDTDLPPVDAKRFDRMVTQINMHDEFAERPSKRVRERL